MLCIKILTLEYSKLRYNNKYSKFRGPDSSKFNAKVVNFEHSNQTYFGSYE